MLLAAPLWAGTYYGGFEDTVGGDYDYNDIVFKITGATLNSNGSWFAPGPTTLDDSGSPFWNHTSSDTDHAHDNIGYCVYGDTADSGSCGGQGPFDVGASYLAAADGVHSVNDVVFTPDGGPAGTVLLTITADTDQLGWYNIDNPTVITYLTGGGVANTITLDGSGSGFGLVGNVNPGNKNFYSNDTTGTPLGDSVSHFAFFATPEPDTMALLGFGLVTIGFWRNRKKA
jgi:hypothetical protein